MATKKAPTKKAAATAASGRAPTKKAPAAKAPAKKAPAKQTPAKAAAKKAPAKQTPAKAAAKKAPAKKAPAKQTPAKAAAKKRTRRDALRERARMAPMSTYFAKARKRATKMLDDPEALKRVAEASHESAANRSGPFEAVIDDFRTLVRLVVAYARGHYRQIPADSLVLIVAGLVYVVSPLDLIPDAFPVAGFADDAVVIGWVIKSVRDELDAFRSWEIGQ